MGSLNPGEGFTEDHGCEGGDWEGRGPELLLLLRCEHSGQFGRIPHGSNATRVGAGFQLVKEVFPASFQKTVVFWLVSLLSDPETWADSLSFPELEFPGLRMQQESRISRSS